MERKYTEYFVVMLLNVNYCVIISVQYGNKSGLNLSHKVNWFGMFILHIAYQIIFHIFCTCIIMLNANFSFEL